jgi:hypothetical protein
MPVTFTHTRLPADATQQAALRGIFSSPGFTILKEMVAGRCAEHQVTAMQALLYPENEKAKAVALEKTGQATLLNALLDMLDDISKNEQDWFTVRTEIKIEHLP